MTELQKTQDKIKAAKKDVEASISDLERKLDVLHESLRGIDKSQRALFKQSIINQLTHYKDGKWSVGCGVHDDKYDKWLCVSLMHEKYGELGFIATGLGSFDLMSLEDIQCDDVNFEFECDEDIQRDFIGALSDAVKWLWGLRLYVDYIMVSGEHVATTDIIDRFESILAGFKGRGFDIEINHITNTPSICFDCKSYVLDFTYKEHDDFNSANTRVTGEFNIHDYDDDKLKIEGKSTIIDTLERFATVIKERENA